MTTSKAHNHPGETGTETALGRTEQRAIVGGALFVPFVVSTFTAFTFPFGYAMPLASLFGFAAFGGLLGAGYGAVVEY